MDAVGVLRASMMCVPVAAVLSLVATMALEATAIGAIIRSVRPVPVRAYRAAPPRHCRSYDPVRIGMSSHASRAARAAEAVFNRGIRAHVARRHAMAAREFLRAAIGFAGREDGFAMFRMAAYRNATWAWARTGSMVQARERLTALAASDGDNRAELVELLRVLPEACAARSSVGSIM